MAEQTFFEQGPVKITSARAVFGTQTYALSGITSVRPQEIPPNRKGPIILMIVGLVCTAGLGTIAGIIWWFMQKTEYAVILVTAGGEQRAHISQDKKHIAEVVNAVNEALIHRG